jgi:hypothetical protein
LPLLEWAIQEIGLNVHVSFACSQNQNCDGS